MTKRQLNDDERAMAHANIKLIKEELEYLTKVLIPKKQLTIEVAPYEYAKQLAQCKFELEKMQADKDSLEKAISITSKQVKEGVESKEVSK